MSDYAPTEPVNVLLIEDNPGDVRLTREAFESIDREVQFHVVDCGEEAREYVRKLEDDSHPRPDIVLLDLNLPGPDGFAILDQLESSLEYPPPPVLVLSSSKTEEDIARSYDNAANAYLVKPDTMPQFDSMARAIDDFWFDTARQPPAPS